MSDLSPDTDSAPTTFDGRGPRPGIVSVLAVLVFVGALIQFITTAAALSLSIRPGDEQRLFDVPVNDGYWLTTAVLSMVLGLIYVWIGRGLLAGNPQSWTLVNVLAIINAFFALFQLPFGTGWAAIFLSVIILALNNTSSARQWFRVYG